MSALPSSHRRRYALPGLALGLLLSLVCTLAVAQALDQLAKHPLELQALTDPDQVLTELPEAIATAQQQGRFAELAKLHLAHANACRVIADWPCQARAGAAARAAAEQAGLKQLMVRGLIAEGRARMATQDFVRGQQLLGQGEQLLLEAPAAELQADILLGYSSMSHALGKHELAASYAERGLQALGEEQDPPMQTRLLRNLARAQAQLGEVDRAAANLRRAMPLAAQIDDPKLIAELHLESARMARLLGDGETQRQEGQRVLDMSERLQNSQLRGLGHEVLGQAAADLGEYELAERELRTAVGAFAALGLDRDELRALRTLLNVTLERLAAPDDLPALVQRLLTLGMAREQSDRGYAQSELEARLKYVEQEFALQRLEAEALLSQERSAALAAANRLTQWLLGLAAFTLLVLLAFFHLQRQSRRRLQTLLDKVRSGEARLTAITNNIPAVIAYVDRDERYVFVNAQVERWAGWDPHEVLDRTVREQRGPEIYALIEPHIRRVLAGERVRFQLPITDADGWHCFQIDYVPDINADGEVLGYYSLAFNITRLKRAEQALDRLTRIDSLTGLANRRDFDERLQQALNRSQRQGLPMCLLYLDIDRFKAINDAWGHAAGDAVIIEFARRIGACVRAEDLVARLGGDEFAILLEEAREPAAGQSVADKLLLAMRSPMQVNDQELIITTSIGIGFAPAPIEARELLALADRALYAAKAAGRNTAALHTSTSVG